MEAHGLVGGDAHECKGWEGASPGLRQTIWQGARHPRVQGLRGGAP